MNEKVEEKEQSTKILEPENPLPPVSIEELPGRLRDGVGRANWERLMPVQSRTIPYLLAGRDLMVQSRTGSGKTGAFVLPLLQIIDAGKDECQTLILVPTRELALQVTRDATTLAGESGIRVVPVYGGVSYKPQIEGMRRGAHLVVGTPGRILDHLLKGVLKLKGLRALIFDEADRLLSMGFYPDMRQIHSFLPDRPIATYMLSATFPAQVMHLAKEFLRDQQMLSLSRDSIHVAETDHFFYVTPLMEKDRCLVRIIEVENPPSAMIFCNTKARVAYVSTVLKRFGYDADELSADLPQAARERVLARVRKGTLRFLVTTDVAARGIDIPELTHVFQFEPPQDPEAYVHRAGRTGRAGASGQAITLVGGMEQIELNSIARRFGIEFEERPLPSEEDVQKVVTERVVALLESRLRARDQLKVERMQRFLPLVKSLAESGDQLETLAMLVDDFYQESLHAPVPQPGAPEPQIQTEPRRPQKRRSRNGRSRRRHH